MLLKKLIEEICYSKKAFNSLVRSSFYTLCYYSAIWFLTISLWGFRVAFGACYYFLGLTTHVIHLEWIYFGSSLLIRYMAVLFVPVSVGIIKYYDLLVAQWKVLLIPNILSTILTLLVIAFIGNYLFYKQSFTHKRKKVLERRNLQAD